MKGGTREDPLLGAFLLLLLVGAILFATTDVTDRLTRVGIDAGDTVALLALLLVVIGWRRSYLDNVEAQRRQLVNEVRVSAYEELNKLLLAADAAFLEFRSAWTTPLLPWALQQDQQARANAEYELSSRMNDTRSKFAGSVTGALTYVEHHRYLFGELESMRLDIHLESLRFLEASSVALSKLTVLLISDAYRRNPQFDEAVKEVAKPPMDLAFNLVSYLVDLRTEAQNLMLGDVFGYTAAQRRPMDYSMRVLRPGSVVEAWERLRAYHLSTTGVDYGPHPDADEETTY